jgi:activator of HSP90 ATPase
MVPGTPEIIYESFMDAEKHSEFTGSKATSDPKVGGKFTAWDGYIIGKNIELEKGKRIVQEWKTTEWPKNYPPSRLELNFCKVNEGTEILLVHSKVPKEQANDYKKGWTDFYWKPLKKYLKSLK